MFEMLYWSLYLASELEIMFELDFLSGFLCTKIHVLMTIRIVNESFATQVPFPE